MTTPNPFTGCLLAALVIVLFVMTAALDGPSELDAAQATQASTQDAIDSVATSARVARAEALIDAQNTTTVLAHNASTQGAK